MTKVDDLKQKFLTAKSARDHLKGCANTIEKRQSKAVEALADAKIHFASGDASQDDIDAARDQLRGVREEAETLPYELIESKKRAIQAEIEFDVAKAKDDREKAAPVFEQAQEYQEESKHYQQLAEETYAKAQSLIGHDQGYKHQRLRQQLGQLDNERQRLAQQENINQGMNPRVA